MFVGTDRTRFYVHEAILESAEAGRLLAEAGALGSFEEETGVLELLEDSAETFKLFSKWLYEKSMRPKSIAHIDNVLEANELTETPLQAAIHLYCFAVWYDAIALQNQLVSFVFEQAIRDPFPTDQIVRKLEQLEDPVIKAPPASSMHDLMVKWAAADILTGSLEDRVVCTYALPADTVRDVLWHVSQVLEEVAINGSRREMSTCIKELFGKVDQYHESAE